MLCSKLLIAQNIFKPVLHLEHGSCGFQYTNWFGRHFKLRRILQQPIMLTQHVLKL